jgi:hypothetical protein
LKFIQINPVALIKNNSFIFQQLPLHLVAAAAGK